MATARRGTMVLSHEIEGLDKILGKFRGSRLYSKAWKHAMEQAALVVEVKAFERVPLGETTTLGMSIDHSVDPQPMPLWAKVTADATSVSAKTGRPFRYGWALESSKKVAYRYRHGRSTGRKTRGWFRGALKSKATRREIVALLARAARSIEAEWRR